MQFLKSHKAEIIQELEQEQTANGRGADNVEKIRAWLAHIGEDDEAIIDEVIGRCRDDTDCMAYFLKRAIDGVFD